MFVCGGGPSQARRGQWITWSWSYRWLCATPILVLGAKLGRSTKAVHSLSLRNISPAPRSKNLMYGKEKCVLNLQFFQTFKSHSQCSFGTVNSQAFLLEKGFYAVWAGLKPEGNSEPRILMKSWDRNQGFLLAKQALHPLGHTPSPRVAYFVNVVWWSCTSPWACSISETQPLGWHICPHILFHEE